MIMKKQSNSVENYMCFIYIYKEREREREAFYNNGALMALKRNALKHTYMLKGSVKYYYSTCALLEYFHFKKLFHLFIYFTQIALRQCFPRCEAGLPQCGAKAPEGGGTGWEEKNEKQQPVNNAHLS